MSLAIYKPGQGYWTRVLTACGAAVLILAGVAWLWGELQGVGHPGTTVARQRVELAPRLAAWGKAQNLPLAKLNGIVKVEAPKAASGPATDTLQITDAGGAVYTLTREQLHDAANYDIPGGAFVAEGLRLNGPVLGAGVNGDAVTIQTGPDAWAVNRLYLQSGVAAAIILGSAILFYWLLNKPNVVDFMIATEAEMKKVNWPTRREIMGSTWVVICGTFLMAGLLFAVDIGFTLLFTAIGIIQGREIFR